jgi:hypothetical protein
MNKELMKKEDFVKALPGFSDKDYTDYLNRERMDMAFTGVSEWRKSNPKLEVTEMSIGESKVVAAKMTRDNTANNLEITGKHIFKQIDLMTEARNISDKFFNGGGFTSCPGDVMTIKSTPGMLSNSISIHITNDGTVSGAAILTDEWLTLANRLEAWEWLRGCNDVHGREVMHQTGDETPIPYAESGPYLHRFN